MARFIRSEIWHCGFHHSDTGLEPTNKKFSSKHIRKWCWQNITKCKVCDKHTETIDHLGSCCPLLALAKELTRHDRLGQYIHWCLYKNFGLPYQSNWWEHKPPKVIENKNGTILLYLMVPFDIYTDRAIQENRPDIVAKNHGDKNCFLIDICT